MGLLLLVESLRENPIGLVCYILRLYTICVKFTTSPCLGVGTVGMLNPNQVATH